ncbi:MAG: hypothetical protein HQM12_23670 [SAR324 cluster bacterium]|nr:hypothetical protein [SAR324 cluster bacterium]
MPRKNYKLSNEEQEILESFEKGEWVSAMSPERMAELQQAVQNTEDYLDED